MIESEVKGEPTDRRSLHGKWPVLGKIRMIASLNTTFSVESLPGGHGPTFL